MPDRRDIAGLRAMLASGGGPAFWRSLDAVAETPAFQAFLGAEFPSLAAGAAGPDRRRFLKLMAASFALAGLSGCDRDPHDHEVPYVRNPERVEPGRSLSYASAALLDGYANGVLVTTRNGRPLKIEGNPQHPWSLGGTDVFGQASVLGLYDPFRSQSVRFQDRVSDERAFGAAMSDALASLPDDGRGLRLLTGPVTSPSLAAQIAAFTRTYPAMKWHTHTPADRSANGTAAAFGRPLQTLWRFDRASVVVALDGDFLDPGPMQVGNTIRWTAARRAMAQGGRLLTLFSAAATPSLTSAKADDHVRAGPHALAGLCDRLLAAPGSPATDPLGQWCDRVRTALAGAHGTSLVLAGAGQPEPVQLAVLRLNAALGNLGQTVVHTEPATAQAEDLPSLVRAMAAGQVGLLLMLGTNPVYTAPGTLGFADALHRVAFKVHAGLEVDETAIRSDWHLPLAHPLESFGDARAPDGTVTLIQPTIAPLYGARSAPELLSLIADPKPVGGLDLLRAHWGHGQDPSGFERRWHGALEAGFIAGSASPEIAVSIAAVPAPVAPSAAPGFTVLFRPDPSVWDGSLSNNPWLQELPKPLTKLVWDAVIAISPADAETLHAASGDVLAITVGGRKVEAPAWVQPGQADRAATVYLGYGRSAAGLLADDVGYDAYKLRDHASPWQLDGATITRTGKRVTLATTQDHNTMEGHDFIRARPVNSAAPIDDPVRPTLYPPSKDDGRAWGMVIDLDACTGCNACVVACQAENNIPVVGKDEVLLGREMHWLRVDRYYAGTLDDPATHFQPVPCMHCEQAPCEVGCPVEATVHDHEGLNLMVYNRCVGTRACESYCPYKVRHFNYLDYSGPAAPSTAAQRNPEVTVRARGVMEKCTYCVQRIAAARIVSDERNAPIPDGAVKTACQGACPANAIAFGDLNDPNSAVRSARHDPRNYALLGELNLRPRTTYLTQLSPAEDGA